MDTLKINGPVKLNITVLEFNAISRLKLAIQTNGMKLVSGGARVQIKLSDEPFCFKKEHLSALMALKENEKPGRITLEMSWDSYCALSQTIDKLRLPKNGEPVSFDLEYWQLNGIIKIG